MEADEISALVANAGNGMHTSRNRTATWHWRMGRRGIFFSSRRRHTRSVSAFLLNRSSDLIRHHDYDQCFQSVQLLQWNSQVKFNVTVYRNLPTTRDSIMTS